MENESKYLADLETYNKIVINTEHPLLYEWENDENFMAANLPLNIHAIHHSY